VVVDRGSPEREYCAATRDAAADLGETQTDEPDQHGADEVREDRRRSQHGGGDAGQAEDARPDDAVDRGAAEAGNTDHALEARRRVGADHLGVAVWSKTTLPSTTVSTDLIFLIASSGTFAGSR
jgi:hypothetical protein